HRGSKRLRKSFSQRWNESRTSSALFWTLPAKAMRFCGAKLKHCWPQINERALLSKGQLLVWRPRLLEIDKLIRSSARRLVTTKFLNRSVPAEWVKSISRPTLSRAAKPHSNSCPCALRETPHGSSGFNKKPTRWSD